MVWLVRTALFRLALALFAMWAFPSIASASDWNVDKVSDGCFIFRSGNWVPIKIGEHFPRDALLMSNSTGALTLLSDGIRLTLGHQTRVQLFSRDSESLTSIYQYSGTIGVNVEAVDRELRLETPFAIVKAQKASLAAQTGAEFSLVAVVDGLAVVFDLTRNSEIDVEAGKTVRAVRDRPLEDGPPPPEHLSVETAEGLAALASVPDRTSPISSLAESIGKYDEGNANLVEAIEYFRSLPWQEQVAAALGLCGVCLLAGLALDYLLGVGLGMIGNSLIIMTGLAVGGFIRLRFLADLSWRDYDPGISIGLTCGLATLFLILATMLRGNRQT